MATPNPYLIGKIREAASNIESGAPYNWGHVGKCNCGHLLQTIEDVNSGDIYKKAQRYIQAILCGHQTRQSLIKPA